jgi:hypothetical protein
MADDNSKTIQEANGLALRREFDRITEKKGHANKLRHRVAARVEAAKRELQERREK